MRNKSSQLPKRAIASSLEPRNLWTHSRKPRTYDGYEVLENVAYVWRLLGLFPITVKGPVGMRRYGISKLYAVYSFLLFAIYSGSFVYVIVEYGHNFRRNLPMATITLVIRMVASLLCMALTTAWRIVHGKEIFSIFTFHEIMQLSQSINKMFEQQIHLEKTSYRFNYKLGSTIIRIYVWTTLVTVVFFMAFDFYVAHQIIDGLSMKWVFWIFPLVTQIMDLTILVSLVGLVGLKFRDLNEKMRTVVARANSSSLKVIVKRDCCPENLRALAKAHYNTCAIGKRINSIFDWDVIVNVTTAFIILSTTLYFIFYEVVHDGETNIRVIVSYVHWEVIHSTPIIIIVIVCNWTSRQGAYARKLIHDIRVKKTDSRLYEAVKSFSLQLHHQKLEFTAGGFFSLNADLLQTMAGKITTYLVILIQFQPQLY